MSHNFAGMLFAVIRWERGWFSDGAGRREERTGVSILVRWGSMETGIFFV